WMHIPVLWDLDKRMRMMKRFPEYRQILTLSMPAIEFLGSPEETPELARLANDGMAEIVQKHPGQFPAFVASLPMNNVAASPYETSAFMARLVFSGLLDRLPKLRIITHHLGAMAPFFVNRIGYGMDQLGARTSDEDYASLLKKLAKRPVDYFRMFYGDTSVNGARSAIRCGIDFYGTKRVLCGIDLTFDPQGGPLFIRETIKALDGLKLKQDDARRIYFGNALQMLKLKLK